MAEVDPFKVMRNSATLEAYRRHQRAARAAAQPWIAIGLAASLTQIVLFIYASFHSAFRALEPFCLLLVVASGLSFLIAALRLTQFKRTHPFEMPPPPTFR